MNTAEIPIAKCDFCMVGNPESVSVVVSAPVLMPDQKVMTTGEWATCGDCLTDLNAGAFDAMFKRWMANAGGAAVTAATLRGETVVVAEWHNALDQLWRGAWAKRTGIRTATTEDRLEMVEELERFRQTHPDRILP